MGKVVKTVPEMLPRERLTKKALAAIEVYSMARAKGLPVHYWMVRYVLEAERMRRVDLYAWLEAHGYRWLAHGGRWMKKGGSDA